VKTFSILTGLALFVAQVPVQAEEHWAGPVQQVNRRTGQVVQVGVAARELEVKAPVFEALVHLNYSGIPVDSGGSRSMDDTYFLKASADIGSPVSSLPGAPTYINLELTFIGHSLINSRGGLFGEESIAKFPGFQLSQDIEVLTPRFKFDRVGRQEARGYLDMLGVNTTVVEKVHYGELGFIAGLTARALSVGAHWFTAEDKVKADFNVLRLQAEVGVQLVTDIHNRAVFQLVAGGKTGVGFGVASYYTSEDVLKHEHLGGDLSTYAEARARFLHRIEAFIHAGYDGRYGLDDGADGIFEGLVGASVAIP
jgi:hypothetical protein